MSKIHFVIDISASMASNIDSVREGIRNTVSSLTDCEISLSTFNNHIYLDQSSTPKSEFNIPTFNCRGQTRLYDCLKQVLSYEMNQDNCVIIILTDGINNLGATSESDVCRLIEDFQRKENVIKFLGCNIDALAYASILGVRREDSLSFDGMCASHAFRAVSENIFEFQETGVNKAFLLPQRTASMCTSSLQSRQDLPIAAPTLQRCKSMLDV